jgi:ribose transport system permease protein
MRERGRGLDRERDGRYGRVSALRLVRTAPSSGVFWILVVLVVLTAVFAAILPADTFISTFNAQTVAGDASVILILAAGATLVIISGGLDLSIGSVMTFAAVASALVMKEIAGDAGEHQLAAGLAGLGVGVAAGVAWGAINGALIAFARLPPFVVTLGSLGAALGAARLLSGGANVSGAPAEVQDKVGLATVAGVPVPFLIAVGLVFACGFLLSRTRYGEHNYLIGSNEEAARRGGIAVPRHPFLPSVLSGALAGCAGLVEVARFAVASVSTGHTTELIAALAAVVIGGASLTGGVGIMSATVVGVFIPVVLANGLLIEGVERFWQDVVVGVILVVAVWFDQWRRAQEARDG